jgi:hypothetical protein
MGSCMQQRFPSLTACTYSTLCSLFAVIILEPFKDGQYTSGTSSSVIRPYATIPCCVAQIIPGLSVCRCGPFARSRPDLRITVFLASDYHHQYPLILDHRFRNIDSQLYPKFLPFILCGFRGNVQHNESFHKADACFANT